MFWETKLAELQKLATVELTRIEGEIESWSCALRAGVNEPFHKDVGVVALGETKAKAVCDLWTHITNGGEPFIVHLPNSKKKYRWNGRWEVLEEWKIAEPVVEEAAPESFDSSD